MKLDSKKIGRFLKTLNDQEFRYVEYITHLLSLIKYVVKESGMTKQEFCQSFGIPVRRYNDFVAGNYEYDLLHMSLVEVHIKKIEAKKLAEKQYVMVSKEYSWSEPAKKKEEK